MIKVNGTDFSAQVGGDFHKALAQIKKFDGAKYDGATKTWTVAVDKKHFKDFMYGFPMDMGDGAHITAYGNRYSNQEWDMAKDAIKEEKERHTRAVSAQNELDKELIDRCVAFVGDDKKGKMLAGFIKSDDGITREQFSTDEKWQAANAIATWYETESYKSFLNA